MSIMTMTAESLSKQLEQTVPDVYVLIAKNSVAGLDASAIADLLGVNRTEIEEATQDQLYKDVRLLIASEYARTQTDTDFSWDHIESESLKGLAKRVQFEKDTETLLKIAAVANKAQRRTAGKTQVLDPAMGGTRVPLTLTSRIVKRLSASGNQEIEETRQISVLDGSAKNPTFQDIDELLGVSRKPVLPATVKIQTHDADDFTVDDLQFKSGV